MLVSDLFEEHQAITRTVVIIPGGFHPLHPGHVSLYRTVVQRMPQADVYMAATDDQSERPFPFAVKHQLAVIAGIPAQRFVQVRSPFRPVEITQQYDAATTALVFVRSAKDRQEQPQPGGHRRDGTPSYFQPVTQRLDSLDHHGYIAYLPTIEFRAGPQGMSSATEIRRAWPQSSPRVKAQIVADLYPNIAKNPQLIHRVVGIFDHVMGGAVAEEATGAVATAAQARDPRYSMSLTGDVRPGEIDRNLRAFQLAERTSR